MTKLTHIDGRGKAKMVDVGEKEVTRRRAKASVRILMAPETLSAIRENRLKKGDLLGVARIAGIMAAKKVDQLIPLTHPLPIDYAGVDFEFEEKGLMITTEVVVTAKTGVEMEALTAAAAAALTVYDMAKAIDRSMEITNLRLEAKSGGRSGDYERSPEKRFSTEKEPNK